MQKSEIEGQNPKLKLLKKQKILTEDRGPSGLSQTFLSKDKKKIHLSEILSPKDWWELKKRNSTAIILLHDAVKKIADIAGISTNVEYQVLISPSVSNNYTIAILATVSSGTRLEDGPDQYGKSTSEIGEVNRSNLGTRGRANPVNMAQKRAYDRAVFRHLGITGLLGEDELQDEEESNNEMDHLPIEEQKAIVSFINDIVNSQTQPDLKEISKKIKILPTGTFNENQLAVLRNLWTKQFGKLQKSF